MPSTYGLLAFMSATELLLAITVFCLGFWMVRATRTQVPKGLKSPPGPWGLPFIGHMLTLGKNPHLSLTKLSQRYGDVLQIRIGSTPVVVLSGLNTIKQALVRQGDDFKGRPDLYSFTLITNGKSMIFNPDSGPVWAARRRLAQDALKSFSIASDPTSASSCYLEEHVSKEANHLVSKFQKLMAEDLNEKFYSFMKKLISEHYRTFEKGHIRDITDSLIEHCQDRRLDENANVQLSDDKVITIVSDLFGAGFDTVTTAISWSLMYLVTKPRVQRKIQEELDTVIGRDRQPRLSDRPQLPYLEAFILETFRHSSFLPFTIPHSTIRDTNLNGFYIPKGCCVFVNQWQVNHDQELWGDPNEFRPERFLTPSGTLDKRLSEKVILFGLGKRKCIGETIGRLEVFLFLAILLQQVEFNVSPGEKVDMTPIYGLTLKHARCEHFQVRMRPSGPQHPQA
ncbi:cytochrome P450 1A1 isoform X2 [Grammomys surdaster]|uniref:cytochrome P450 1A1 isoform X2 n=1 Tax=Grammomys surdaster TaxID=491861 RepID=UPI00109FE275|nr:cytochrome P450 1A1 isoform X2 [Grammomys surdaster]